MISEVARGHGYERLKEEQLSAIEKYVDKMSLYPCQQGLENSLSMEFYLQYSIV